MNYTSKNFEEIKNWLKENLTEEKYLHSLGVMETAKILALKFDQDIEKAQVAGLLHDCAKNLSADEMKNLIKNENLNVYPRELAHIKVLHAPCGACIAHKEFGVCDDEILSAIRLHTIASKDMSEFDKIIFIADKIELKTRERELFDKTFSCFEKQNGLDRAMCFLLGRTIKYLIDKQIPIENDTIEIYNCFINKI